MAVLFIAYLLTAQVFAYIYNSAPTAPALIWPAAGIALAGLILGGRNLWPAIALASFTHQMLLGNGLIIALGIGLAATLQPLAGAWFLQSLKFRNSFSRVPDTIAFILVALFITTIVPTLGIFTYLLVGKAMPLGIAGTFIPWWIGQILSVLIVTPFIIRWFPRFSFYRTRQEYTEAALALGSLVLAGLFLYWTPYREVAEVPLVYLILIPFLWLALRIGPRFMTLALLLNAALALGGTAFVMLSSGTVADLGYALLQTEIFIIMISIIFLLLVSIAEERKDVAKDLLENVRTLEDAIERLRKEDEAKSKFIATLAHELRNPLAPLMSSLEIMRLERTEPEATARIAGEMTEHLHTMRHLLNDLLDISRISREKLALQTEQVELAGIVNRALRTVAPYIQERRHELITQLPEHGILLEADPVRLEQVLVNLLNNAAKYTEPGGTITLTVAQRASELVIVVEDTGIGMDETLLEHVFEAFFQIDQPGKLRSGLGIGLSLTRNLVEMHGGTIEAKSEGPGRGSTFTVHIPLPDSDHTKESTKEKTLDRGASLRILVVDDNRAAADALSKLLSLRGHTTEAVYLGEQALTRAPAFNPDVIILDIGLPDMDGYDIARALRTDSRVDAVLVALTGYGQESDVRKAEKAGFEHHLTKPAGLAEIEEILSQIAR